MTKKEIRALALELIDDQIGNTCYSLEREEYSKLTQEESDLICAEVDKIHRQFIKRYFRA